MISLIKIINSYQHTWMNEPMLQTPDLIKMQEIIFKYKPKIIIDGYSMGLNCIYYFRNYRNKNKYKKIIGMTFSFQIH